MQPLLFRHVPLCCCSLLCLHLRCAGIARSPGPCPSNPSIVRNCQFLNIWKTSNRNSGIAIEFSTLAVGGVGSNNWRIERDTFDTSYQGVFINANDDITITGNSFTRCVSAGAAPGVPSLSVHASEALPEHVCSTCLNAFMHPAAGW
jgi:hypothetical protein